MYKCFLEEILVGRGGVSTLLHVVFNKFILKTAGVNFSFLAQLVQNLQAIKGC